MKFIHIADVHLGAAPDSDKPWGAMREKEIWDSFRNMITVCNEEKVDLLLIAGDLFHRQPLVKELKEVNYCFSKLETAQVIIMAGNHDYIGARSNYQGFEWNERVHMFLKDTVEVMVFDDIHTEVYGLSYRTRDITAPLYDAIRPDTNDRIHILLAHGGDDRNIPMNRRRMLDSGFDYIAMGHIHKPEILTDRMAYAGSLEPLDRNETGERGYILGEISNGQTNQIAGKITKINFIPSSLRQYRRLKLTVDQDTTNGSLRDRMKEMIEYHGRQNIYSFRIEGFRDEHIIFDVEGIKETAAIGNILDIEDRSVPNYDFDRLYRENANNLIGLYIKRLIPYSGSQEENPKHEVVHERKAMDGVDPDGKPEDGVARDVKTEDGVDPDRITRDEITRKALYYGIEALLGARDR